MRTVAVLILGVALGVGGTFGVQAVLDDGSMTDGDSFRAQVRDSLAEEWGDIYAECMQEANDPAQSDDLFYDAKPEGYFDDGGREDYVGPQEIDTPAKARTECRRQANTVLP